MFDRLGAFLTRYPAAVVIGWLLLAGTLRLVAPRWDDVTQDGDLAYLPAAMPSSVGQALLDRAFPDERAKSELAVIVEQPRGLLSAADLLWSDSLAELFREHAKELNLAEVWNRNTEVVGGKLVSRLGKNGQAAVTVLKLEHEFMAVANIELLARVRQLVDEAQQNAPPGLKAGISGSAAIGGDMLQSAVESIQNTELTTVVLVILILLVVYRAPLLVLVPLATIGVSLVVSLATLGLLTRLGAVEGFSWWHFKVFSTTRIFIVVILFGAGTDFCLFLIARYREELERGLTVSQAVAAAVGRVSEALVASAMTTILGLSMMFFADFGKFRNSGPAVALCLAITLLAALTLAPALLALFGKRIFWPFGSGARANVGEAGSSAMHRFWHIVSGAIVARPGLILVASIVLLLPFAYHGWEVDLTFDLLGELQPGRTSVQGSEMARRHFSEGEMTPITVLAYKHDGHFNQPRGERDIARLTKILFDMNGIGGVRSIAAPTGDPPGYIQPFRKSGLEKLAARRHRITKARFLTQQPELAGQVARFDIVLDANPFSPRAVQLLNSVEAYLQDQSRQANSAWRGAEFAFVGTTVGIRDLEMVTGSDERLIQRLVTIAVLIVLVVLLRRPVLCVYLVLSVLFSYFVTLGITELFFAWLYGDTYYGLDWKVPVFLFVILIAVGEDYNIYLVTRVVEEQRALGPVAGLRRAVERTGGIITSCGVIMAGTFISMTTGTLRGIVELGFAMSLGILLDTCIVRPILVPAFLALIDRVRPPQALTEVAPAGEAELLKN